MENNSNNLFPQENRNIIVTKELEDSDFSHKSIINMTFFKDEDWGIILGYKTAGDKLVNSQKDSIEKNTIVYPIIFIYRQFIELYMKYIYRKYISNSKNDYSLFLKEVSHDLDKIFDSIFPIIDKYFIEDNYENKKIINFTKNYISELQKFDKKSMSFRYSMDKDGNLLREKQIEIDIINLKECINQLANIFFEIEEYIAYGKDYEKYGY